MVNYGPAIFDDPQDSYLTPSVPDAAFNDLQYMQNDGLWDVGDCTTTRPYNTQYSTPYNDPFNACVHIGNEFNGGYVYNEFAAMNNSDALLFDGRHEEPLGLESHVMHHDLKAERQRMDIVAFDSTVGIGSWCEGGSTISQGTSAATVRPNRDRRPACKECTRPFATEYLLEEHAKRAGHKTYVCAEPGCSKSYCRRDVLLRHTATHKSSEFVCSFCTQSGRRRSFKRKDHLVSHMRNRHSSSGGQGTGSHPQGKPSFYYDDSECSSCEDNAEDRTYQSEAVREIASALGRVLGPNQEDIQKVKRFVKLNNQSTTDDFARSLARLALSGRNDTSTEVNAR